MVAIVRPFFTVTEYNGVVVISAEIPECDPESKPCFYRLAGRISGSYVRVGESNMPMTEYEVYSYEVYKRKIRGELWLTEKKSER